MRTWKLETRKRKPGVCHVDSLWQGHLAHGDHGRDARATGTGAAIVVLVMLTGVVFAEPKVWTPRDFGAKADGVTLDTKAIQAAVDACAQAGGGIVQLSGGVFLSGTIRLRSGVTLSVATNTVLRGSAEIKDYESITPQINYLYRARFTKSLIYAERQVNVGLSGEGVIDGQGHLFPAKKGDDGGRPYLIRFSECRRVRVKGLTFLDSARWLSHYLACEDVEIARVTIRSRIRENRDGMDIDSCDGVRITDCDVFSGDDAIVLKSTVAGRPCRNVTVTGCRLSGIPAALKLGTESQGGFEDITFSDCSLYDSRDGIAIEEVDGGLCQRVCVSNVVMSNVENPFFIRLGNRGNPVPGEAKPGIGQMRDITLSNVRAEGAGQTGCSVTGLPGHPVERMTLRDIRIRSAGGGTAEDAARAIPEKEKAYPSGSMFGILAASGLYVRHVDGLNLHGVIFSVENKDARPAMVIEDVRSLETSALVEQPHTR